MHFEEFKGKEVQVEQKKSTIGCSKRQIGTLKGLGLRGIGSVSKLKADDAVIGMLRKVAHLVEVK